jgi:hypothetical protein
MDLHIGVAKIVGDNGRILPSVWYCLQKGGIQKDICFVLLPIGGIRRHIQWCVVSGYKKEIGIRIST